jgi:hypothetical protein
MLLKQRTSAMSSKDYRNLVFCAAPDRVAHLKDPELTARFTATTQWLTTNKKLLVDGDWERKEREKLRSDEEDQRRWAEGAAEHYRKKAKRDAARAKRAAEKAASQRAPA